MFLSCQQLNEFNILLESLPSYFLSEDILIDKFLSLWLKLKLSEGLRFYSVLLNLLYFSKF